MSRPYLRLLAWACLLALPVLAKAQLLEGTVRDDAGQVVPYANIYLEELASGVATDEDGTFSLRLSRGGDYRLITSAIGYLKSVDSILVAATGVTPIQLTLKRDIALLDEVVVRAARRDSGYIIMREVMDRRRGPTWVLSAGSSTARPCNTPCPRHNAGLVVREKVVIRPLAVWAKGEK